MLLIFPHLLVSDSDYLCEKTSERYHDNFVYNNISKIFQTIQRASATNSKIGPVDLSKNENDCVGLKEW